MDSDDEEEEEEEEELACLETTTSDNNKYIDNEINNIDGDCLDTTNSKGGDNTEQQNDTEQMPSSPTTPPALDDYKKEDNNFSSILTTTDNANISNLSYGMDWGDNTSGGIDTNDFGKMQSSSQVDRTSVPSPVSVDAVDNNSFSQDDKVIAEDSRPINDNSTGKLLCGCSMNDYHITHI